MKYLYFITIILSKLHILIFLNVIFVIIFHFIYLNDWFIRKKQSKTMKNVGFSFEKKRNFDKITLLTRKTSKLFKEINKYKWVFKENSQLNSFLVVTM